MKRTTNSLQGNGKGAPKQPAAKKVATANPFGIPNGFSEADLNDPSLLAELEEFGWVEGEDDDEMAALGLEDDHDMDVHGDVKPLDMSQFANLGDDPDNMELTADDMNDGDLEDDLRELGWSDDHGHAAAGSNVDTDRDNRAADNVRNRISALNEQILHEKKKAVALKKEGKLQEALQALKSSKGLETELQTLQKQLDVHTMVVSNPFANMSTPPSTAPAPAPAPAVNNHTSTSTSTTGPIATSSVDNKSTQQQQHQQQQQQQKEAAQPVRVATAAAMRPSTCTSSGAADMQEETDISMDDEFAMELDNPFDVDLMVSNEVLEREKTACEQEMTKLKSKGQRIPDELEDRVTNAKFKIQMLVANVSSGRLTQDQYMNQVTDRINKDKKLAAALQKQGRKADAQKVLDRVTLMEAELSGALDQEEDEEETRDEQAAQTQTQTQAQAQAAASPAKVPNQPSSQVSSSTVQPQQASNQASNQGLNQSPPVKAMSIHVDPVLLQTVRLRLDDYKSAAIHCKRISQTDRAVFLYDVAKELKTIEEQLLSGKKISTDLLPPPLEPSTVTGLNETDRRGAFDRIRNEVKKTLEDAKVKALTAMKAVPQQKDVALFHHRRMKRAETELLELAEREANAYQLPPKFHFDETSETTEIINTDVPADNLQLRIDRIVELSEEGLHLTYSLGFPSDAPITGTTHAVRKPFTEAVNYVINIPIAVKTAARAFEYRKATFEVLQSRFLRKDKSFGKTEVKLNELLTKSEIRGVYPLVNESKKPIGGKLEISLRLRSPLKGKDVRTVVNKFIVVDEYPAPLRSDNPAHLLPPLAPESAPSRSANSPAPVSAPSTAVPARMTTSPSSSPGMDAPSSRPNPPVSSGAASSSAAEITLDPAEYPPEEVKDPHSLECLMSNNVLEAELTEVKKQEEVYTSRGAKMPAALMERKRGLEFKMQLLVTCVETGKLTIETYVSTLKQKIEHDKKLCVWLNQHNRQADAVRILKRVKIMSAEIADVEANADT